MSERTERVETNLLNAFHGCARSMDVLSRCMSVAVSGFEERLGLPENRVSELERKAS